MPEVTGSNVRLQAIRDVEAYVPPTASFDVGEAPGAVFGSNVFSKSVMQKRLPKSVFKSVIATIENAAPLAGNQVGIARSGADQIYRLHTAESRMGAL